MKVSEQTSATAAFIQRKSANAFFSNEMKEKQPFFAKKEATSKESFFNPISPLSKNISVQKQANTIQRMAICPEHLEDAEPTPRGWHDYNGSGLGIFHCGFRTILESRTPTPDDPMNECVYDHSGNLVDANHPYAGCRGTPDQYDGHAGTTLQKFMHAACDTGGIVAQGIPAYVTSRRHDMDEAIQANESIPSVMKPVLIGTSYFAFEVVARLAMETLALLPLPIPGSPLPLSIRTVAAVLCGLINLTLLTIRLGRAVGDFFRRLIAATTSGWQGVTAFVRMES